MSLILILTEVKDEESIQVSGVLIFRSFLGSKEFSMVESLGFDF
jgi:hypothetical protein